MKDRSDKARSYTGALMDIGEPAEAYIARYLEREYVKVIPVGKEKRRRDYRCFLANGTVHLVEGKTDTKIAQTSRVPWEVFRLERGGMRAYISWGYASSCYRVVYFVPQWLRIVDIRTEDMRRAIFEHLMGKGREVFVTHTLTDSDRITFIFLVPLSLLREKGCIKEVDIAEIPLGPAAPHQIRLNGAKKSKATATTASPKAGSELEQLRLNWKRVIGQAPEDTKRTPVIAILASAGVKSVAVEGDTVVLAFRYPVHKALIEKTENQQVAERIIGHFLGHSCHVRCIYEPEDDHLLKAALKLGAQIINKENYETSCCPGGR